MRDTVWFRMLGVGAVASVAALSAVILLTSGVAGYTVEEPRGEPCRAADDDY